MVQECGESGAADQLIKTELSDPTITRRGKRTLTYQQEEMVSLASRLAETRSAIASLQHIERKLLKDQDNLLTRINARGNIATFPNDEQRRFIRMFELAMKGADPEFLRLTFDFCETCGAHRTSWTDANGQPMMIAFSTRLAQMGDGGKGGAK